MRSLRRSSHTISARSVLSSRWKRKCWDWKIWTCTWKCRKLIASCRQQAAHWSQRRTFRNSPISYSQWTILRIQAPQRTKGESWTGRLGSPAQLTGESLSVERIPRCQELHVTPRSPIARIARGDLVAQVRAVHGVAPPVEPVCTLAVFSATWTKKKSKFIHMTPSSAQSSSRRTCRRHMHRLSSWPWVNLKPSSGSTSSLTSSAMSFYTSVAINLKSSYITNKSKHEKKLLRRSSKSCWRPKKKRPRSLAIE